MVSKWKKITLGIVMTFAMVFAVTFAAVSLYPYATMSFNGIQMVNNNGTTQGFIDITLKNINATGVTFCLEYDTEFLELSDVTTNDIVAAEVEELNISHKYFEQNTDIFPDDIFQDKTGDAMSMTANVIANLPIIGISDQDSSKKKGHLKMNFIPKEDASERCDYIEHNEFDDSCIMANSNDGLKIGRISFCIKKPDEFAKLSQEELKDVIKIVPFSSMTDVIVEPTQDTGIGLAYVNSNGNVKYYTNQDRNIKYEFNINVELADVQPEIEEITVSSYDIYKNGTVQDLFDLLNEKMSAVILTYADGTRNVISFNWNQTDSDISGSSVAPWNPLGGTEYTVTQKYNDFDIKVKVKVNPVTLIGFVTENEVATYLHGASNFPKTFEDLQLPSIASPILDTYIPNNGVADFPISWYSLGEDVLGEINTLPDDFNDGDPHNYLFLGHIDDPVEEEDSVEFRYPWLTVGNPLPQIRVLRNVVTKLEDMPNTLVVEDTQTDENGVLTLTVRNMNYQDIPDGTTFDIRLPDGDPIDTASMGSRYSVTFTEGKAIIVLAPDITTATEQKLAQMINLGNRVKGKFSIASTEPGKNKGSYTKFETKPRKNVYLPSDNEGNEEYVFDYSSLNSLMLPMRAGTNLNNTITIPLVSDFIRTTYSGYDGMVEGQLRTFTVEGWDIIKGDKDTVGSIVTARGKLANTTYANYGEVVNDNNVYVNIKYVVLENNGEIEKIEDIPDVNFGKRQEGYGYDLLLSKSFNINNIGNIDIHGLTASISLSANGNKEAFVITQDIPDPRILSVGQSVGLDIATAMDLTVLKEDETKGYTDYVCTVTIMSNTQTLKTFQITFTVTKLPVYDIKLIVPDDQKDFGTVKTGNGLYTAEENELVTIIATPTDKDDYAFVEWKVVSGYINSSDLTQETISFLMPNTNVTLEANFREKLGAKLRATELIVKDTNDADQKLYNKTWNEIQFDPLTRTYYSVVSNDTDKVKLWFKLREEAEGATLEATHQHGAGGPKDNLATPIKDPGDEYFKTEEIPLDVSPVDNIVELSITHSDLVNHPDEGVQTRKYTIHIYRKLKNSELIKFNYGNSPFGLIMRDSSLNDDAKEEYKQAFVENKYMFTEGKTPQDGVTNIRYISGAWDSINYDMDPIALFVINTDSFTDPGFSEIKNSLGDKIDASNVSKKVTVNLLAETEKKDGSSEDFVYIAPESVELPLNGEVTNLKGKRIRPDCYELAYSFTDYDGRIISVSKPIIILSPVGDVNISGETNDEDISRILNRFSTDLATNFTDDYYNNKGLLFKYRVCDANNDGNLNAIDANRIRMGSLTPFYENLLEGGGG